MLALRDRSRQHGIGPLLLRVALALAGTLGGAHAQAWRSALYPESWTPPGPSRSFATDKLVQDFSYAGYRRGEAAIPALAGPVFEAADHGADPTGTIDSTDAIQAAIDAAAAAGGGVVLLAPGEFRVAPAGSRNHALSIAAPGVVLRGAGVGQTFLLNTSHLMRGKAVIAIGPAAVASGSPVAITSDLPGPTRRIPVADPAAFEVGDAVRIEWTFTQGWIDEHSQQNWWSSSVRPANAQYLREVTAINTDEGWLEVDVPTRYTIKTRDDPRVFRLQGMLSEVGLEGFSIGNVQHPGSGWGEEDYNTPGTAAYDVHASWLIRMSDVVDAWIARVESYQPAGNTSTCHMLSNGILLLRSARVTVRDAAMRRSQYGGGGGNGYMYRLQYGSDNLLAGCVADFSRHGFVLSHAGTSGNVFHRCEDRNTARSTGSSGSYTTGGSGSDHHMHFSHSNLFDLCLAHDSFWTAHHRGSAGTVPHGLTAAHSLYWNTRGSGTRYPTIVRSEQARYGYIIGTSGSASGAANPTGGNTAPADHLEGIGLGATLEPQSLYLDQLNRRLPPPLRITYAAASGGSIEGDAEQWVDPGGDGTPVTAVAGAGMRFVRWSDGLAEPTRQEQNVANEAALTAYFGRTLPHAQDFEAYADGAPADSVPGWLSTGDGRSRIAAVPYDYAHEPPLPESSHALVLDVSSDRVAALVAMDAGEHQRIYLDAMIRFSAVPEEWWSIQRWEIANSDSKFAMLLHENRLHLFHGGADGSGAVFTPLGGPYDEHTWHRVTVAMNMAWRRQDETVPFFRVFVDGELQSSETDGFQTPSLDTAKYAGGHWFRFARHDAHKKQERHNRLMEVAFDGTGQIDDFVLTDRAPSTVPHNPGTVISIHAR